MENEKTVYLPEPLDTTEIELPSSIMALVELLAKNAHDIWARERIAQGWVHGSNRCDIRKEHPCLIHYNELSEEEKECDRKLAIYTLRAVLALGYSIEKATRS